MHDEHAACVRAWWAARPEAASAGTPLGQDGDPPLALSQAPEGPQGRSTHVWASGRAGAACWLNSRLPARISQNLAGDVSIGSHTKRVPLSHKLPVKKQIINVAVSSTVVLAT
jgi:hypothetical protein